MAEVSGYTGTSGGSTYTPPQSQQPPAWTKPKQREEPQPLKPPAVPAWARPRTQGAPPAMQTAPTLPPWLSRWMQPAQQQPISRPAAYQPNPVVPNWISAIQQAIGAANPWNVQANQQGFTYGAQRRSTQARAGQPVIQYAAPIGPTAAGGNLPSYSLPGVYRPEEFPQSRAAPWASASAEGATVAGGYHGHGSPSNNPYYWTIYPMLGGNDQGSGGGGGYGYGRGRGRGGYSYKPPAWMNAPSGFANNNRTYRPLTNWTIG